MLRDPRTVLDRLCIARWVASSGISAGTVRIEVEGCDPRIVVVPRLWVERDSEPLGDIPADVSWTTYSAGLDSKRNLIPLQVVDGTLNRTIRAATLPDGTIPQGDNLELQCSTPIVMIVKCGTGNGDLETAANQSLWFALDCYPADPSLAPADIDFLLHQIKCSQPAPISLVAP